MDKTLKLTAICLALLSLVSCKSNVISPEGEEDGAPYYKWEFNASTLSTNGPTFTGVLTPAPLGDYISIVQYDEGDHNHYIQATKGDARLRYINVDKNIYNPNQHILQRVDTLGRPNITGGRMDDYWQFSVKLGKTFPAGTKVDFSATVYATGGGLKFWALEIFDGAAWKPMCETKSETVTISGTDYPVTYTHSQTAKEHQNIQESYILTEETKDEILRIRYRATANISASLKYKDVPDGGVHRLEDSVIIELTEAE